MNETCGTCETSTSTSIGKYLGKQIGEGSSGQVYLLHHFENKQYVVKIGKFLDDNSKLLKFLPKAMRSNLTNSESQTATFVNSIVVQILASSVGISPKIITHSNVHTNLSTEGTFIVMEHIEGLTLTLHNKLHGCSEELKKNLTNAVNTMHNLGIVHNDLCSDNILITSNMGVYIVDFGSSKLSSDPADFKNDYIIC